MSADTFLAIVFITGFVIIPLVCIGLMIRLVILSTCRAIKANLQPCLAPQEIIYEIVIFSFRTIPLLDDIILHLISPVVVKKQLILVALTNQRLFFVQVDETFSGIKPFPGTLKSFTLDEVYGIEYEQHTFSFVLTLNMAQGIYKYPANNDWKRQAKRMAEVFLEVKH